MARRTKDEAESTRNAILDAAEDLFYARGVSHTSLDQIARAASVTRGAVYWHFKDKADLFEAIMKREFLPHEEMLADLAARGSDTPLDDLADVCRSAFKKLAKDKRRQKVATISMLRCENIEETQPVIERGIACEDRMIDLTEALLIRARALGQLDSKWTPRSAAVALYALVTGLILGGLERRAYSELGKTALVCLQAFISSLRKAG